MFFSRFAPRSRGLALFSFFSAGALTATALVAEAHPHYKKRHHSSHSGYVDNVGAGNSARDVELQVTVHQLIALDRADAFSKDDLFAVVTIGGQVVKSERIKQADAIHPNWKLSAVVPNGRTDVKLAVYDKDLTKDDPIDINRLDGKRDLDFVVDTRRCRVEGFSQGYNCGNDIRRAGAERKKAEVVFMVTVNTKP